MSKRIRIGVLGSANIAKRYFIPAILESKEMFSLEGVASRNKEKAEMLASEYGCTGYSSYDNLIEVDNIDAIYIPLPNSLHFPWIKKSLSYGKHVIVEKTMTCAMSETIELNRMAEEKKLVLLENFQFQFHAQLPYIIDFVSQGKIGELRAVRSDFGFPPFSNPENIRYKKELGGGALLDAGAYPLKLSQILLGLDLRVDSGRLHVDSTYGVDLWGSAQLVSEETEVVSQISFGFDNFYQCSLELWGSKGKLFTNRIFTAPPGFQPLMIYENPKKVESIKLPSDQHFVRVLEYFFELINDKRDKTLEYVKNINQARLIQELRERACG